MNRIPRITGAAVLGLAMLTAAPIIAQAQDGRAGRAQPVQAARDFSRAQLQKFANANAAVRNIRQSAKQKMQQAGSKEARTRILKQARQDMLQAIKDAGMTLKQYNRIARAARVDPQLAKTIQQMQ